MEDSTTAEVIDMLPTQSELVENGSISDLGNSVDSISIATSPPNEESSIAEGDTRISVEHGSHETQATLRDAT